MWVEARVTDSFLDLAELLESLAEGVIVGVPGEAAVVYLVRLKFFFFLLSLFLSFSFFHFFIFSFFFLDSDQKMGEKIRQIPRKEVRRTYWTKSFDMMMRCSRNPRDEKGCERISAGKRARSFEAIKATHEEQREKS